MYLKLGINKLLIVANSIRHEFSRSLMFWIINKICPNVIWVTKVSLNIYICIGINTYIKQCLQNRHADFMA